VPLTLVIALIAATPNMINALLNVIEDIKKSGHPVDAPLTPAHIAAITAAVTPAPAEQDVPGSPGDPSETEWDIDHENSGG
jgi:hypothetical protein